MTTHVDQAAVKSGQAMTALVLVTAFVTDAWPLAAAIGAANLLAAIRPSLSLTGTVYRRVLLPNGIVRSRSLPDDPTPHRFAQGFSGVVTLASAALVAAGLVAGWALSWLVVVLAGLNLAAGFCAGCFTYHLLHRAGLLGVAGRTVVGRRGGAR
ncbi:MAG TPA: DUF4395 domain-containing protein [Nitriliruptoraceae bacterium]|nr:DUF4395 domain-containing protein [Nitriliruptoraceae bacterium]